MKKYHVETIMSPLLPLTIKLEDMAYIWRYVELWMMNLTTKYTYCARLLQQETQFVHTSFSIPLPHFGLSNMTFFDQ